MLNITRVEMLIEEKGWKKPFFCSLFGKERGWISDWKRGRGLPDENMLSAIAETLGTTVDYLTDKTDIKNRPSTEAEGLNKNLAIFIEKYNALSPEGQKDAEKMIDYLLSEQGKKS